MIMMMMTYASNVLMSLDERKSTALTLTAGGGLHKKRQVSSVASLTQYILMYDAKPVMGVGCASMCFSSND